MSVPQCSANENIRGVANIKGEEGQAEQLPGDLGGQILELEMECDGQSICNDLIVHLI